MLVEGSHYIYIVSLILLFFPSVDYFGLQELFEGWAHIEIHKIENCMPAFIEPEGGDPNHTRDPIV